MTLVYIFLVIYNIYRGREKNFMVNQVARIFLGGFNNQLNRFYSEHPAKIKYVGYRNIYVICIYPPGQKECPIRIETDYGTLIRLALSKGQKVGGFGYAKGYEPKGIMSEQVYEMGMKEVEFNGTKEDFLWLCVAEHFFNISASFLNKLSKKGWHTLQFKRTVENRRK